VEKANQSTLKMIMPIKRQLENQKKKNLNKNNFKKQNILENYFFAKLRF